MHKLTLNNGAIHHLAQFLAIPGALTEAADLYRAGELLEEKLSDLPMPIERDKSDDDITATKKIRAWQREGEHVIELTERQRETCKKAVQEIIKKGVGAGPSMLCLIKQLGLAPEN